jgi:eukaryotic-like serine/threonine-protein kinase
MDARFALTGYVVDELIGFGGTGEVWRALDNGSGETVALKRLRNRGTTATERLRREAALLATVAGPHVIGVRGVIVEGDEAVLVMDYAAGGSLAAVLGARERLPAPEVVTILAPIASALAAAHARGLVHGDLTPANILFTADGRPLLADFGVAQALGAARDIVEGTVDFLDPAIVAGSPLVGASDVFALGAIGFTALAGQPLWGRGTPDQIQARASIGVRPSLDELAPDVPPALVAAIEAALRLEPDERPDARSFANAVLRACAAAPVGLAVTPTFAPAPMTQQVIPRPVIDAIERDQVGFDIDADLQPRPTWRRHLLPWRRYLVMWVTACLTLMASAGLGLALGRHGGSPDPMLNRAPETLPTASMAALPNPSSNLTWEILVSRLEFLRTQAFAHGDATELAAVYAPRAAAYATDKSTLSSLASRGLRARGFAATVERVSAESGTRTTERLRVVDRLSGYDLVDASGKVVGHGAARPARAFTMQVSNASGRWRVTAINPAA